MTKSQLIESIARKVPHVPHREVEAIVNAVFDCMSDALAKGQRIEIRGFGSFSVKVRPSRDGRNPKTGERVKVPERRTLGFIAGKELRDRLNPEVAGAAGLPGGNIQAPAQLPGLSSSRQGSSSGASPGASGGEAMAASAPAGSRYTLN